MHGTLRRAESSCAPVRFLRVYTCDMRLPPVRVYVRGQRVVVLTLSRNTAPHHTDSLLLSVGYESAKRIRVFDVRLKGEVSALVPATKTGPLSSYVPKNHLPSIRGIQATMTDDRRTSGETESREERAREKKKDGLTCATKPYRGSQYGAVLRFVSFSNPFHSFTRTRARSSLLFHCFSFRFDS